jgi:CDP-diacylglycerol--glycerol-3-phosphate 3-phosphatidyltransferase
VGLDASPLEKTAMNVPNLLSISRILAVPVFIVLMLEPTPLRALIAAIVFSIASATDWLDGYLARKWGQVTKIGKLLDPVADKILVASALIMLVDIARIPSWIAIVIIGRELAITGLRAMAAAEGIVIAAENMGKWKVGAQITAVLCLVLDYHLGTDWISDVGRIAIFVAMVLAVISGLQYIRDYWQKVE